MSMEISTNEAARVAQLLEEYESIKSQVPRLRR
jgi:hypothetical protein